MPSEHREGPFESTLDNWLGLVFLPSMRNTGKAGEGAPAGGDRRKSTAPPRHASTKG